MGRYGSASWPETKLLSVTAGPWCPAHAGAGAAEAGQGLGRLNADPRVWASQP